MRRVLALVVLLVGLAAFCALDAPDEVHDLTEVRPIEEEGDDVHAQMGPVGKIGSSPKHASRRQKVGKGFLTEFFADGRNEMQLSAKEHVEGVKNALDEVDDSHDGMLGESDEDLMSVFSEHKEHQPLKSLSDENPSGEWCLAVYSDNNDHLKTGGKANVRLEQCNGDKRQAWFFNRFTKRLELEAVPDMDNAAVSVEKCLSREPQQAELGETMKINEWHSLETQAHMRAGSTLPQLKAVDCGEATNQLWDYLCQAWVYDEPNKGPHVITSKKDMHGANQPGVEITQYYGKPKNLWYYKEVVRHSRCKTKRFKTMKFLGSLETTVSFKRFASLPFHGATFSMWIKPEYGTIFSYASDGIPTPPYTTQIAASVRHSDKKIQLDLFDRTFDTEVVAEMHKWFYLTLQWDTNSGVYRMYIDAKEKWKQDTFKNPYDFTKKEFVPGGCVMIGQKAKKPCKERIPESSYKGEVAEFIILYGAVPKTEIEEYMFTPVDPAYIATITDQLPVKPPDMDKLLMAYLTRQYGEQEIGTVYPPVCNLVEETDPMDGWAGICDDPQNPQNTYDNCYMSAQGTGDVHYYSFGQCKYDDQSVAPVSAVHMQPTFFESWPLEVQFFPTPLQSGASWGQTAGGSHSLPATKNGMPASSSVYFPATLSMVSACAIKFRDERIAWSHGGWHYQVSRRRLQIGRYTRSAEYGVTTNGVESVVSGYKSYTHTTKIRSNEETTSAFVGTVNSGRMDITMPDGLKVYCSGAQIKMTVPRKLEGKFGGFLGGYHKSTVNSGSGCDTCDFLVGPNHGAVAKFNAAYPQSSAPTTTSNGNSDNTMTKYDYESLVAGKPLPGIKNPGDPSHGGWCRNAYQYHGKPGSPLNGNRFWKGITKMFYSWSANGNEIPEIFGGVKDKMTWEWWEHMSPAAGASKAAKAVGASNAEVACESLKKFPTNFANCVADFAVVGAQAVIDNKAAASADQAMEPQAPSIQSVRDSSGGGWHASWVSQANWGCVDEFSAYLTKLYGEREAAKHKEKAMGEMCSCKNKYLDVCSYDHFICIADIVLDGSADGFNGERKLLR